MVFLAPTGVEIREVFLKKLCNMLLLVNAPPDPQPGILLYQSILAVALACRSSHSGVAAPLYAVRAVRRDGHRLRVLPEQLFSGFF